MKRWCAIVLVLAASGASAASRGQYGGTLRISVAGEHGGADPLLNDSPQEAALTLLSTAGACRLTADGRVIPALLQELSRTPDGQLRLMLRPQLKSAEGAAITAQTVAQAWMRASAADTRSPYRALLFPLEGEGRYLAHQNAQALALKTAFPWPDLESSLCHPALAVPALDSRRTPKSGAGPFVSTRALGVWVAQWAYPGGRPYVDRLTVTAGDPRNAARLLNLGDAEVGFGADAEGLVALPPAPALYATYLAFRPQKTGANFRPAFERAVERSDLTRFFVRAPSVPMSALLPPALMPQEPPARSNARAAPPRSELTLLYDATSPDQKGVAERLQVKLHDAGYRVSLRGVSRSELRAKWASGDFDLMLHAVLLPPQPAPALAVALDVGGRHDLLGRELPPLGRIADAAQRDQKTRERAQALATEVNLIPLYAQSLRVVTTPRVQGLHWDGFGVPVLDDAFFGSAAP